MSLLVLFKALLEYAEVVFKWIKKILGEPEVSSVVEKVSEKIDDSTKH